MTTTADKYRAKFGIDPSDAAGLVQLRTARQTGGLVGVYNAATAGIDADGGWATVCETHGTLVIHPTRSLAMAHAADPCGWCEPCRSGEDQTPPAA